MTRCCVSPGWSAEQLDEPLLRCLPAQGRMPPAVVMDAQVAGQPTVPFLGVLEGHGVGPFLAEGLDEPLGLAVGSGRVRPGSHVPQPVDMASLGERLGDVGGVVVTHQTVAFDLLAVEPGDGTAEKADHRWLLLLCQYLDVSQLRGVVDGNMGLAVADAVRAALLAITGDAVTHLP